MKTHKTYYDSELDTWVIDNSNIEKGDFDKNPSVVSVESLDEPLDKVLLLLLDLWRIPLGNGEIDDKNNEIMKHIMDLKEELGLPEFMEDKYRESIIVGKNTSTHKR